METPRATRVVSSLVMTMALAAPARADDEVPDDRISGFFTAASGELRGQVLDDDGHPIEGAIVHVASPGGEHLSKTDHEGRYRVDLGTQPDLKMVFVRRIAKINGVRLVETQQSSGEAVLQIEANDQPPQMPKLLSDAPTMLEYSDRAIERDAWTRAWLLLYVDEQGRVARLKLIKDPGYDLGEIALRAASKLRFDPARDKAGKPTPALVVWGYDWPSFRWMRDNRFRFGEIPEEVTTIPCHGAARLSDRYRDCAQPDMVQLVLRPWISPQQITPGADRRLELSTYRYRPPAWYEDRIGWAFVGSGAFLAGLGAFIVRSGGQEDARAMANPDPVDASRQALRARDRKLGGYLTVLSGAALTALGVHRLAVVDDGDATTVSLSMRF
jgi:hypothetical protein